MTEEEAPTIATKRRRVVAAAGGSPQVITSITDVPSGILAHAASFLAAPSKALFAISLDQDSAVLPNERSSTIVGNQWDVLDFGQIERDLAEKLTDLIIKRVLLCIDAVNNLKRLKLANCTKITGVGLEPLRGSLMIEQIDLSLVGDNQHPELDPEPPISWEHVLPILDSIIAVEGCALMHLQFPLVWRNGLYTDSDFHAFYERYNEMYRSRGVINCLECNESLPTSHPPGEWMSFGRHKNTCYGCLKHYCNYCMIDGKIKYVANDCGKCKRFYCEDCTQVHVCHGRECHLGVCIDCKYECHKCNEGFCEMCLDRDIIEKCQICDRYCCSECNECYDEEEEKGMGMTCQECDIKYCNFCRLRKFRQGQLDCADCIKRIASLLVGVSSAQKQLQEENEQLKVENGQLKRENKELKLVISRR
ncbi:hypothetical protein ACHAWT_000604 [Skeletonema menzelii]